MKSDFTEGREGLQVEAASNRELLRVRTITTEREREIWACMANGYTVKEAAMLLCIAPSTVQTKLKRLHIKLGVRNAVALSLRAIAHGIIPVPRP